MTPYPAVSARLLSRMLIGSRPRSSSPLAMQAQVQPGCRKAAMRSDMTARPVAGRQNNTCVASADHLARQSSASSMWRCQIFGRVTGDSRYSNACPISPYPTISGFTGYCIQLSNNSLLHSLYLTRSPFQRTRGQVAHDE